MADEGFTKVFMEDSKKIVELNWAFMHQQFVDVVESVVKSKKLKGVKGFALVQGDEVARNEGATKAGGCVEDD